MDNEQLFFCSLQKNIIIIVYFFVKVVAMVTRPKVKIMFSGDILSIFSHISNTENLLILFLCNIWCERISLNEKKCEVTMLDFESTVPKKMATCTFTHSSLPMKTIKLLIKTKKVYKLQTYDRQCCYYKDEFPSPPPTNMTLCVIAGAHQGASISHTSPWSQPFPE